MSPLFFVEVVVMVVLGASALAVGGGMALKPGQRPYEMLRPLTYAMVFGALSMSCTGLANLLVMLGRSPFGAEGASPAVRQAAFMGLAELIVPIMLTFAVLTVAWGLAAIGLRRLA